MSAQPPTSRLRRALALGTATAFGLGGLFAAPAFAETAAEDAPTSGTAFEANSLEMLAEDGVEAVGRDGDGNVVILTSGDSAAADAFDAEHGNVVVKTLSTPFSSLATTDVVGGAGYVGLLDDNNGALCSVGFGAWDPEGNQAVVTAGHCADDGAIDETYLTVPSSDTAGGGDEPQIRAPFGLFGFSQFGGPGNTTGANGDPNSVDIAVIDVLPTLDVRPEVTDWSTVEQDDLSLSTTEISSVGAFDSSKPVAKSGRTSGYTTGTALAGMEQGWSVVSGRVVKGFALELASVEGDSGGAIFQGETAVGVLSGGGNLDDGTAVTWAADLQAGLALTGGYTIMLALDAPKLSTPSNGGEVERGAAITGTGPASTDIVITPEGGEEITVESDAQGRWSFPAPNTLGSFAFSVQAVDGFNVSESNSYELEVVRAPLAAPVILSPTDRERVENGLTAITGTGFPGATIEITKDVEATTTVQSDGTWSVPTDLSYGQYTITATQSLDGETSPEDSSLFFVVPSAPIISTPEDGAIYAADEAPEVASGIAIEDSRVTVAVNGVEVGSYDVGGDGSADEAPAEGADLVAAAASPDDNWEVRIADALVEGENVLTVTQTVGSLTSDAAVVAFEVLAAPAESPATPGDDDEDLAVTGGPDLLPIGIGAWLLVAAGIAATLIVRKRRLAVED